MESHLENPRTPIAAALALVERLAPAPAKKVLGQWKRDAAVLERALFLGERPSPLIDREAARAKGEKGRH